MHVCVCVCAHGGHGNTSLACLVVWLKSAHLTQTVWWKPSIARGPLRLSCKSTMGIHHDTHHTIWEMVFAPGPRSLDSGPCYCPWLIHPSGGSPAWPKFKASKSVTQCPLAGSGGTSHVGLGGQIGSFTGLQVCVRMRACVCACVRACMRVCMYTLLL